MMKKSVLMVLGLACLSTRAPAQMDGDTKRWLMRVAGRFEVPLRSRPPAWAVRLERPRFRYVHFSDFHLTPRREGLLRAVLAFTRRTVRPAFAVITGDNVSVFRESYHRRLKKLLDEGLGCPYFILAGDNDARHFRRVFGSSRWSFTYGGVHFAGCALDVDSEHDGVGYHRADTLAWLWRDLRRNRSRPTLYLQHENLFPPLFLGAPALAALLYANRNVVGVLNGHLHLDFRFRLGRLAVLSAPGLGPNPRHPFKVHDVYRDGIVVSTCELVKGNYQFVGRWSRIPFPRRLWLDGAEPRCVGDVRRMAPREPHFDLRLARAVDLVKKVGGRALRRLRATLGRRR